MRLSADGAERDESGAGEGRDGVRVFHGSSPLLVDGRRTMRRPSRQRIDGGVIPKSVRQADASLSAGPWHGGYLRRRARTGFKVAAF
jgi:hypothetical protein